MHHRGHYLKYTILFFWLQAAVVSSSGVQNAMTDTMLATDLQQGEAIVWYLGHCGYAVLTAHHLLIFDYIELEEEPHERGLCKGFVDPQEIRDMNVCVFVTHGHIDHYDEVIFSWEQEIETVRYFLGWEPDNDRDCCFLAGPRAKARLEDIEVYTVNSQHSQVPEVAFLVKVDGLVMYHGGDYQGKMGRDAPSNVLDDMAYLKTMIDSVDLFFIGAWTGEPYIQSIEHLDPAAIFPMHDRKKESKYRQFALDLRGSGIEIPVYCPEKRGDCFHFLNGQVQGVQR